MTRVKVARRHQFLSTLFFLVSGAVWLSFVVFVIVVVDDTAIQKGTAFVSFLMFVGVVVWRALRRETLLTCPDCGGDVEQSLQTEGQRVPLLRLCKRCDVLWHVGNTPDAG
jgi:hypothetical protein